MKARRIDTAGGKGEIPATNAVPATAGGGGGGREFGRKTDTEHNYSLLMVSVVSMAIARLCSGW